MKILDLPLPKSITTQLQELESFDTLNPPQEAVVKAGLFDRKNFLIAIPTASGKTFIAELACLQHVLQFKGQVIYLTPLKALALEKFHDFKRFEAFGISTGITIGDYDSADTHLFERHQIIVSTNEKIDSLLRHNPAIMKQRVSLLVIDECHLIDEASRGPTLETLIVKIKRLNPTIQMVALSATVQNAEELASWLQANLILSNWRSVPVEEYFCNQFGVVTHRLTNATRTIPAKSIIESLVLETLSDKGQVLIFANSRKNAQSIAHKLKDAIKDYLSSADEKKIMNAISSLQTKEQLGDKTSKSLGALLKLGIGFHHAGLSSSQRIIVETLFKQGIIKIIVATPTLAAGINLPARRVIISSIWRFSTITGRMVPIKVMDYEQMRGRSGRPRYDTYGESFIIASSERDEQIVFDKYFSADNLEPIESKLSAKPTLRIHLLGFLATSVVKTYSDLQEILQETFFGFQYNDYSLLEKNLRDVTNDLESFGFIKLRTESIKVTRLGKRVSQLYIDPVTANIIIDGIIKALTAPEYNPLMFMHLFSLVPDIRRIHLKKHDWGKLDELYARERDKLLSDPRELWHIDYQKEIDAFKTALIVQEWISEIPLPDILTKYSLDLGDFQNLQNTLIWLCYSAKELARELIGILKEKDVTDFIYLESLSKHSLQELALLRKYLSGLEIRITEGIKEDLITLINLKGLGRVKARALVKNGIKNVQQLQEVDLARLVEIPGFGPKLVQSIAHQLDRDFDTQTSPKPMGRNLKAQRNHNPNKKKARSLVDFAKE